MKKNNNILWIKFFIAICIFFFLALSISTYLLSKLLFIIVLPISLVFILFLLIKFSWIIKEIKRLSNTKSYKLNIKDEELLNSFSMSVCILNIDRQIIWCNNMFKTSFHTGNDIKNFSDITGEDIESFYKEEGFELNFNDRIYKLFGLKQSEKNTSIFILYFQDITDLKKTSIEYDLSKPCVLICLIDNFEEAFQNIKESEKSKILGKIDKILENFIGETNGFIKPISRNKFIAVIETRDLNHMIEQKFSILDKAKELLVDDVTPVTISIGIGTNNKNLLEDEIAANHALDMALGRGGDQVAIKNDKNYEFFGGLSGGLEKRTKVKTRMVANAMTDLIKNSENVIVMGHKFSDLDCVGSSIGIASAIRSTGKDCYIAIDKDKTLSSALLEYAQANIPGSENLFLDPKKALEKIKPQTLLIIVDTHNPDFIESFEVYQAAKTIIVIDHHRKMVNYIKNSVIFYHEPYASSTSEIVTELIQYFGEDYKISKQQADCLIAGIVLDTKGFVMRTGVRTFEAAAYLRKLGCDTIAVKKLFSNNMQSYKLKSELVSRAEIYKNCAITYSDDEAENIRVVSPQAADELLNITGIDASFVIFKIGCSVNISARSMGSVNVQTIMETLGGGGHQNMAATQMGDISMPEANCLLLEAIDKFYEKKAD